MEKYLDESRNIGKTRGMMRNVLIVLEKGRCLGRKKECREGMIVEVIETML